MNDQHLYELARSLGEKLVAAGQRVAVAESCTGGWVGKVMTGVPGSSNWFECGFATYTNVAKMRMLDVPEAAFGKRRRCQRAGGGSHGRRRGGQQRRSLGTGHQRYRRPRRR